MYTNVWGFQEECVHFKVDGTLSKVFLPSEKGSTLRGKNLVREDPS